MRNNKALRVILPIVAGIAAVTSTAVIFMKRHKKKARVAVIPLVLFGLFCCLGFSMTAYAQASPPPETAAPTTTVPATTTTAPATSTPEPTSKPTPAPVPTSQPSTSALTPQGDLTLVDDIQTGSKQIMTVVTKSGNYFYIVIDRSGSKENVYFLNLVDESDLMAIINGKKDANGTTGASGTTGTGSGAAPVSPPASGTVIQQPTEQTPVTTTPQSKGGVNTGSIIIVVLLIAGAGGGIFYYFRILKPKQGAAKGGNMPELEEYDFEDGDDIINDNAEQEPPDNAGTDNAPDNGQEDEDE